MAISTHLMDLTSTRRRSVRQLALNFSGNYTTGGDNLDLTAIQNPNWIPAARAFAALPVVVSIANMSGGFSAEVIPGSALNNYLVKIWTAEGTELAAGAYPVALSGATDVVATVVSRTNV